MRRVVAPPVTDHPDPAVAEPEEWWVTCARCGTSIRGERSRLFWSTDPENPGTYRTCKNDAACERRQQERGVLHCDLCSKLEYADDLTPDWNGETGNHLSCEAKR